MQGEWALWVNLGVSFRSGPTTPSKVSREPCLGLHCQGLRAPLCLLHRGPYSDCSTEAAGQHGRVPPSQEPFSEILTPNLPLLNLLHGSGQTEPFQKPRTPPRVCRPHSHCEGSGGGQAPRMRPPPAQRADPTQEVTLCWAMWSSPWASASLGDGPGTCPRSPPGSSAAPQQGRSRYSPKVPVTMMPVELGSGLSNRCSK